MSDKAAFELAVSNEIICNWRSFLARSSFDTPISLWEALELIMGQDFYKWGWGEHFPGYFAPIDEEECSKLAISYYNRAVKDIKHGKLSIVRTKWRECSLYPKESYEYMDDEPPYTVFFGDFIIWAVKKKIYISKEALYALGAIHQGKFNPQKTKLQAVAQVLWYKYPSMTIVDIENHAMVQEFLPNKDRYASKNTLRDTISLVDPRAENQKKKPKKIAPIQQEQPHSFREIPGIFIDEGGHPKVDLRRLITACENIVLTLNSLHKVVVSDSIEAVANHPLIEFYLKKAPTIIGDSIRHWLTKLSLE